jgi:polyisoprenoid-binding protein YceI
MQKIIIIGGILILLIGGYIFIKDQQIKKELSKVGEAQFVDQNTASSSVKVASKINANKGAGLWNVTSDSAYTINPASLKFEFTGYKPGGEHVGTFNVIKAEIGLSDMGEPVQAMLTFDPKTVKTDSEALNKHLQAAEFFDTAVYSEITAVVKEFKKEGDSVRAITDLTMKGVTKTLSIPVVMSEVQGGVKFTIDTRVKISDYRVAYGPVLDEVRIFAEGVVVKK